MIHEGLQGIPTAGQPHRACCCLHHRHRIRRGRLDEVVSTFAGIITDLIGLVFSVDAFSSTAIAGVNVGAFITALIMFFITAAVLYFGVVTPYQKYKKMRGLEESAEKSEADLLVEIRDLLAGR